MADSKDKQIAQKPDSPKESVTHTARPTSIIKSILYLTFIIVLTASAGAGGYYLWQQQQSNLTDQESINSNLQNQLSQFNSSVSRLNNQISNNNQIINAIKLQQTELSVIAQKAISINNRGQREWILAEINYLLHMANRRLQIANDINSSIAALLAADQRIFDLSDLTLFPVREQLQKDIAILKAIHQVDINGTAMSIDQILGYLSSLPFKSIHDEIKSKLDKPDNPKPTKQNTGFIDTVIDTVINLGDIKIHDRSLQPMTNAVQQHQIEQTLRSHFLTARLSVLRHDQTQYIHDLTQCQNILDQYYNLSDNRVAQLQIDITNFKKLNLSPKKPNINSSWLLLNNILTEQKITGKKTNPSSTITHKAEAIKKLDRL